jgi:hypothetical protein
MKILPICFIMIFILVVKAQAQDEKSLNQLIEEMDSLFAAELLPLDLIDIVDKILASEDIKFSSLIFRTGYVSNITSAGRSFGFDKYGFVPSIMYSHYSGFNGSVTGYWGSAFEPKYYMTNASLGYMNNKHKHWSFSLNHDSFIFHDTLTDRPFGNSAQSAIYYQTKKFDIGLDYAFLYGKETAHRISINPSFNIVVNIKKPIESIRFMPGLSFQWGNANILYLRQQRTKPFELFQIIRSNHLPQFERGG